MTDHKYARALKALESYTTKITKSKTTAKRALVNEGIYTGSGKLSAKYGGRKTKKAVNAN